MESPDRANPHLAADACEPDAYAGKASDLLQRLFRFHLRGARVWLFGSRATGRAHRRSDFDVAYLPGKGFDPASVTRLREDIEASEIIYRVDLVDLSDADKEFRKKVLREGVPWRS